MDTPDIQLAQLTPRRRTQLPNDSDRQKFVDFASTYNKHYASTEESDERLRIFYDNDIKVKLLNQQSTGATYKLN